MLLSKGTRSGHIVALGAALLVSALASRAPADQLPVSSRAWECRPGVIRNNGADAFRVEVRLRSPAHLVRFETVSPLLTRPAEWPIVLRDDGLDGDRVAGDLIYTSGQFRYNPVFPMPSHYRNDPASPAGLDSLDVGALRIEITPGVASGFLLNPAVGLLRADIPSVSSRTINSRIAATTHVVNFKSTSCLTQAYLREMAPDLKALTALVLEKVPDTSDFLVFFSTQKIEYDDSLAPGNFNAGRQTSVRVDFLGTGRTPFDQRAAYGSDGRLQGVVVLDLLSRGILANNLVHELSHHWGAHIDPSLGLTDATRHYGVRTSVGSLLGGQRWLPNGDGSFTFDCSEGVNGATRASPLDLYMMGLMEGAEVPDLYTYDSASSPPQSRCGQHFFDAVSTRRITDIQDLHGVRFPGPGSAQRNFRLGFVVESVNRMLTSTELTYYEILAAHVFQSVHPSAPDPYVGFNWVPVGRFFGEGTTWSGDPFRSFDLDGDQDVDQSDFGLFQACMTGSGKGPPAPGCETADVDHDSDIDRDDVAAFKNCVSGPNVIGGC